MAAALASPANAQQRINLWEYSGRDLVIDQDSVLVGGNYRAPYTMNRFVVAAGANVAVLPYAGNCETDSYEVPSGGVDIVADSVEIRGSLSVDGRGYTGGGGGAGWSNTSSGEGGTVAYTCLPTINFLNGHRYGVPGVGDGLFGGGVNLSSEIDGGYLSWGSNDDETTDRSVWLGAGGRGGYGGHSESDSCCVAGGAAGGNGGGFVRLSANSILVTGSISANGITGASNVGADGGNASSVPGPGHSVAKGFNDGCGGGCVELGSEGGAGAGGGILLASTGTLTLTETARISSLGGRSQTSNGGTVKLFAKFLDRHHDASIVAGRTYADVPDAAWPGILDFGEGNEGWQFGVAAGMNGTHNRHRALLGLDFDAQELNSFGFATSPTYTGFPADTLIRARYTVESSIDASRTPAFRVRAFERNFTQTAWAMFTSATGANSPTPQGRDYDLVYRTSPFGTGTQRFAFDVIHFIPEDAFGSVTLKALTVTASPLGETNRRPEAVYTFDNGTEGWETRNGGSAFRIPDYPTAPGWIGISPAGRLDSFGFWKSPAVIPADSARIYIVKFTVDSDVPSNKKSKVPTFRLRVNESNFDAATGLDVPSHSNAERSPTDGAPQQYTVYFRPSGSTTNARLVISFDLFHVMPSDDGDATVRLQEVSVDSVAIPATD